MNYFDKLNNYLKLDNAEFLYNQFSHLFYTDKDNLSKIQKFKKINLSKQEFIDSCQNPVTSGDFSLSGLIFNYYYLFHYKLFGTILVSIVLLTLLNITTSFFTTGYSIIGYSFFYLFLLLWFNSHYTKVLYARKIYKILNKLSKENIKIYNSNLPNVDNFVNKNPKHSHSYPFIKNENLSKLNLNKFLLKTKPFNFIFTTLFGTLFIYFVVFSTIYLSTLFIQFLVIL